MVCHRAHPDTKKRLKIFITVCLRQAGEILPDWTAVEKINDDKFGQLLRNKTVHLLSLFLMVYIGVEVTIGGTIFVLYMIVKSLNYYCKSGWIVSFLMIVREGGPSSGYVSSGFFGGKYLIILLIALC